MGLAMAMGRTSQGLQRMRSRWPRWPRSLHDEPQPEGEARAGSWKTSADELQPSHGLEPVGVPDNPQV